MRTKRTMLALAGVISMSGCAAVNSVIHPEEARVEAYTAKRRAEVEQYPDGDCAPAEQCKYRCEAAERALDCYKTGKAALGGVDVHYKGGWRVDKVAGSTDDVRLRHEDASQEHVSLFPLARESFGRACAAKHAESCRLSGELIERNDAAAAATFYRKACDLRDQPACEALAKKSK